MLMRKIISVCLALTLILGIITVCFAKDEDAGSQGEGASAAATVVKTIAHLDFMGPTVQLSLKQALDAALTSGSAIKAAEIKKGADAANAKSSQESLDKAESDETVGRTEKEKRRKAQEYYKTMADRNFEAAKNQITYDVTNAYYSLLHAEENVRIAEESLKLQESILQTVKQKFAIGIVANQDVLQAEISVMSAKGELAEAELSLAERKMQFNEQLGYDQMQDVKLTSPLEPAEISELSLELALAGALANRNELYARAYNISTAQSGLDSYRGYPASSASVLSAKNSLSSAEKSYVDTENSITREVKLNYAKMINNQIKVANADMSLQKSKESFDIYMAKFKLGMATLAETQQAQIDYAKAEKSRADTMLNYNLSVLNYEQSATVGTSTN